MQSETMKRMIPLVGGRKTNEETLTKPSLRE